MPSNSKKVLYLGTCMEDLLKLGDVDVSRTADPENHLKTAEKAFNKAEELWIDGDEEKSFVLFMRYINSVEKCKKTLHFAKKPAKYNPLISKRMFLTSIERCEVLKDSLLKRYKERKEAEDKIVEQPLPPKATPKDLTGPFITPGEVYSLLSSKPPLAVVVDCRGVEDRNQGIIIDLPVIYLSTDVPILSTSLSGVKRELSRINLSLKSVLLVLMDSDSQELTAGLDKPVLELRDSLHKSDTGEELREAPRIIDGGFESWRLQKFLAAHRRDELLEQVSKMRREFVTKNISVVESIKELEEMRSHLEKMSVKQNLAMKKQQESLADIDSEIEKLKIGSSNDSEFKFNCSINQLIEQVKHFGEVIDESSVVAKYRSIYSKKLTAVQKITGSQNFQFGYPLNLHIDYDKQLLYVLTLESALYMSEIAVFNANDFIFIFRFGANQSRARCIAISKEFVYVGYGFQLIQYKSSDYSVVKSIGESSSGIFISSENLVYVLGYSDKTYKFRIYDRVLNFKEERDLCYQWPESEPTISAKQIQERFFILFDKQLLVFTKEGKNTHSIFHGEGKSPLIQNPTSFCIDEVGNIIVTDSATNSIKFFSPEGDLFHKIGEDTVGSDEVAEATDIVVFNGKVIVSCRDRVLRVF